MFCGHQARKNDQAARANREVVETAAKSAASELHDSQPAPFRAKHRSKLLQRNHAVSDALKLEVGTLRSPIVQQQDGAFATDKKLLQRKDLTTIAQGALCEQAKFGKRVENNASGIQ